MTPEEIRWATERLIKEATALPPAVAAKRLRERANMVHRMIFKGTGGCAFALADARDVMDQEAHRLQAC